MALETKLAGGVSNSQVEVDADKNAFVRTPGFGADGVETGGGAAAGQTLQSEIDTGELTGERDVRSPETDDDYRLRVSHDNMQDQHSFIDTAQYTEKFFHAFTTLTATQSAAGLLTNSGGITTTTTGMTFGSHGMAVCGGTETLVVETSIAFSAQPTANTLIDFGAFQRGASTAFAPLDGVYFRLSAAGLQGIINNNGNETPTAVFPLALGAGAWVYANNEVNRFLIQVSNVRTTFWVNNFKIGEIPTPVGYNFPCLSKALPWSIRHAIVGGAAGAVLQALVKDYRIYRRGPQYADNQAVVSSRVDGAFRGLTTATLGSIGTYTNSTNPAAAVPTNTSIAVGAAGLLNQAWETFSLAVNTDGVLASFQNPAGSATVPGRRLKILGVSLSSFVQTILAGGPCNRVFALCFGHTAVSLATAETASFATGTTKARRVVLMPELTQAITAAQAVNTMIAQPGGCRFMLPEPIYINPGEFVAVTEKIIGTVGTSGTIVNHIQILAYPE